MLTSDPFGEQGRLQIHEIRRAMAVKHHMISWKHELHMCASLNSLHVSMPLRGPITRHIDFGHFGSLGV